MTKIYSAVPGRHLSFSPDKEDVTVTEGSRMRELPRQQAVKDINLTVNAPLARLPENFIAAMRAKGWLKTTK